MEKTINTHIKDGMKYVGYIKDALKGNGSFASKYTFIDRKKDEKKLLYILAGYKPYLWDEVFERINKFIPNDIEVCVLSSGKYVETLEAVCEKYGWSYLYTERNNICVISNIVLRLFSEAELVYKMDEDMFLTQGCFGNLERLMYTLEDKNYDVGFVGPYVPLNSCCLYDFLEERNATKEFEEKFGEMKRGCAAYDDRFRIDMGIDSFVWDLTGNIDEFSAGRKNQDEEYRICELRYMIGFILFRRSVWERMGKFKVGLGKGSGSEGDEGQLISYSALQGLAMAYDNTCAVGHFSFGGAEDSMMKFYNENPHILEMEN